jgi:hypothetical protein
MICSMETGSMANPCSPYNIPDPAGYWEFPDGGYQPVATVPSWVERVRKKVLYGLTWKPYQRIPSQNSER